jgi:hypothetical protein
LRPEARLILACAHSDAAAEREKEIQELLAQPLDWPYLHRMAFRNGAIPFLDRDLTRLAADRVPKDSQQALRAFSQGLADQNQFMLDLLLEWQARFAQQGIHVLPYVEAISSFLSYGRTDLRGCTWLDFVVRPADLAGARELLREYGRWQEMNDPASEIQPARRRSASIWGEGPRESALCLHVATAPWGRAIRMEMQDVWEGAAEELFGGKNLPTLSPEDTVLHLCAQNSEYLWASLQGICDVAEVIRAHPVLQWEAMLGRARECGIERMFLLGVGLCETLLDCRLPELVSGKVEEDPEVSRLKADVVHELFDSVPTPCRTPEMLRLHLRMRERDADRLRYLWRFLIAPTAADRNLVQLPARLHFLYPWLRPVRLAAAVARRVAGRPLRKALKKPESISGYSPSGVDVVNQMLKLADVRSGDVVFDLGCGDGRIVIEAARRFGVRGVGMDLDPQRIRECEENSRAAGVQHLVTFRQQDVMRADLSAATVVFMYLPPGPSLQLAARMRKELPARARIISHNADPGGWDKVEACCGPGFPALIYLWTVPEGPRTAPGP